MVIWNREHGFIGWYKTHTESHIKGLKMCFLCKLSFFLLHQKNFNKANIGMSHVWVIFRWLWWKSYAVHCQCHRSTVFAVERLLSPQLNKEMHAGQKGICSPQTILIPFITVMYHSTHALLRRAEMKVAPFVCCQATSTLIGGVCTWSSPVCLSLPHQSYTSCLRVS